MAVVFVSVGGIDIRPAILLKSSASALGCVLECRNILNYQDNYLVYPLISCACSSVPRPTQQVLAEKGTFWRRNRDVPGARTYHIVVVTALQSAI